MTPKLIDPFNRTIEYVRVSVTDRCDLRCRYCLPQAYSDFQEPEEWLSFDEIERVVRAFAELGVRRIRLTGGEPLTRRDLPLLAARLAHLPGVEDLSLSTNGVQLKRDAAALCAAGVHRLNVSLDSLRPERFARGDVETHVIEREERAGTGLLPPSQEASQKVAQRVVAGSSRVALRHVAEGDGGIAHTRSAKRGSARENTRKPSTNHRPAMAAPRRKCPGSPNPPRRRTSR